jgi:hypothetical protein
MPPGGRPPIGPEVLTSRLVVRLTSEQARAVRAFAVQSGQDVSAAARELLAEGLVEAQRDNAPAIFRLRDDRDPE